MKKNWRWRDGSLFVAHDWIEKRKVFGELLCVWQRNGKFLFLCQKKEKLWLPLSNPIYIFSFNNYYKIVKLLVYFILFYFKKKYWFILNYHISELISTMTEITLIRGVEMWYFHLFFSLSFGPCCGNNKKYLHIRIIGLQLLLDWF